MDNYQDNNAVVLKERKILSTKSAVIISTVILVLFVIGALIFWYLYYYQPVNNVTEPILTDEEKLQKTLVDMEFRPTEFTLVNDALKKISLSEPTVEDNKNDLKYFQSLSGNDSAALSDPYLFSINGLIYEDFLNQSNNIETLSQMHDEIRALAFYFANKINRPSVQERTPEVPLLTPLISQNSPLEEDVSMAPIYPALGAVDAFYITSLYARLDPDETTKYQKLAANYAIGAIANGQYSKSDIEAARNLVAQYFALLEQHQDNFFSHLIETEVNN